MIKRFFLALSLLAGLLSPALGAGTITMSMTQRFDNSTHLPLSGGLIYFIQAGTTSTPQNAYQDSALTIPYANPLALDSGGNVPQLFFADGVIKVRVTNRLGVQQLIQDNIQVTGASSGGGGGGTVDATTILATGDFKLRHGTGVLTGFVRANGRTIGSATSGATERANADAQTLFEYLWGADGNLAVSTGRGASANADWVANKALTLPDFRSRAIAGLDDMGNSGSGRLTTANFGQFVTVLGAVGGAQTHLQTLAELVSHLHNGTTGGQSAPHVHSTGVGSTIQVTSAAGANVLQPGGANTGTGSADHTHGFTSDATGGGAAFNITQPTILITVYLKL